ncbi:uncharacterized protein ARMOST_05753 [Armillaria ostoyae]|uniref:Uncharacterized protein n=1 Tax=Armillaria ostoyae TaxID=47428 RepID=A0A284R143_ARMOS|nr:uncharacterized protein ARMOST_05753 [Armillaria ostoyae]
MANLKMPEKDQQFENSSVNLPENEARQEWLTGMRIMMFRMLASGNNKSRCSSQFSNEEAWYGITQCFIPPKVLRARHKSIDELWAGISQSPTQVLKKQARKHIETTWKPNPSLFDGIQEVKFDYPSVEFNALEMVERITQFNSYHIKIELLQGDISQELMKMAYGIDNRPPDFPRTFTRMWLSNVPDYTHGPMNMAVFAMPNLDTEPDASVAANYLLNPSL